MEYERIKEHIIKIAAIGAHEDGATNREFGTENFKLGQKEVVKYFQECGMETRVDTAGNVHGILSCKDPDAEEIWMGSHIDTVNHGGPFDGLLGVVTAAEVIRDIKNSGVQLTKTLHLIGTNGEEGNDMGGTFGSRAMMGMLPLEDEKYLELGKTFGFSKDDLENAVIDTSKARCWIELHIEQGPTLDKYGEQIGIVTGIVGLRRFKITVKGHSNHAGTTMMADRNDALVHAARLILMGDELARQTGHHFVETVGLFQIHPSSVAVIPDRVEMVLEIRNESEELMDQFMKEYLEKAKELADFTIEPVVSKAPIQCDPELIRLTEEICKEQKIRYRIMPSGATHDGNAMAMKMPVGMIFVPSVGGISHDKEEWTEWKDIYTGADVLEQVLLRLAAI